MPRTRSSSKRKISSLPKSEGKITKKPRMTNTKPTTVNKQSEAYRLMPIELERCRDWLMEQSCKEITEYDQLEEEELRDDEDLLIQRCVVVERESASVEDFAPILCPPQNAKVQVNLLCEWQRCKQLFSSFLKFRDHFAQTHLLESQLQPNPTDDLYECQWDLCNFKSDDVPEFRRHAYHHVFHSNLKSIGESLLQRKTVPPCVLDSRRRNTIPDCPVMYSCEWQDCNTNFEQIYDFIEHMRAHAKFEGSLKRKFESDRGRILQCGWAGCDKEYDTTGRFLEHMRSHTNERRMACPNCGSSFTSYNKFYAHFNRQGVDKKFQCVHCYKFFYTEELLTNHMYIHVNCYKCTMCDMTCPSPSALSFHMRQRHISDKPFRCQLCEFGSAKKRDLERHILAIHEKHVYECDEFNCDFSTESLFMMRKHDKQVHCGAMPNWYACHCCSKRYRRGYQLSRHLIKVHSFQLPSGHSRFTYSPDLDGLYRLQTMRMESLEVTQAIMSPSRSDAAAQAAAAKQSNCTYELSEIEQKPNGPFTIVITEIANSQPTSHTDEPPLKHVTDEVFSMPDLRSSEDDCSDDDDDDDGEDTYSETDSGFRATPFLRKTVLRKRVQQVQQPQPFKSIQDFSVMKRYLRNEHATNQKIIIEVTKVDDKGKVIRSETVRAEEFRIEPDADKLR